MNRKPDHISICICTYKRQALLEGLLHRLRRQRTSDRFTFSVVVVDNDRAASASDVVKSCKAALCMDISYYCEPEQNIARARNVAVSNAFGEYLAFLDDDELPADDWLVTLYDQRAKYGADGVLAPVLPYFETAPPDWVVKGKFFERPIHDTGTVLSWKNTRTGNVLIRGDIFDDPENRFDENFLTSEDREFFKRMIEKGYVFIWCNEAPVNEIVPPGRWKISFMIKRALFRGKISLRYPDSGPADILKSAIAVPCYALCLPFLLVAGRTFFLKYLIKTFDHMGKLLAFLGIDVVRQKYVT